MLKTDHKTESTQAVRRPNQQLQVIRIVVQMDVHAYPFMTVGFLVHTEEKRENVCWLLA